MSSFEPRSPALEIGKIFELEVTMMVEAKAIDAAVTRLQGQSVTMGGSDQLGAQNFGVQPGGRGNGIA